MGLEEKFGGDSLAAMAYFDSGLMMPQTVRRPPHPFLIVSEIFVLMGCLFTAAALNYSYEGLEICLEGIWEILPSPVSGTKPVPVLWVQMASFRVDMGTTSLCFLAKCVSSGNTSSWLGDAVWASIGKPQ